mgnify:CR=1 FL=1
MGSAYAFTLKKLDFSEESGVQIHTEIEVCEVVFAERYARRVIGGNAATP